MRVSAQQDSLVASSVSLSFAGVQALRDVDLALHPGEVLGLIGPNGAGKTTLTNVLTGFSQPDSGTVRIGRTELSGLAPHRIARAGVARTFQGARVFPLLTVEEHIQAALSSRSRSERRDSSAIMDAVLADVGLEALRHVPANSLSFGQERTLGVARAMALKPTFLLLDEPAAGLNESEGAELQATIRGLCDRRGTGVMLIEHDMALVMSVCDRIQVLSYGETIAVDVPERIRRDDAVIEAYLGEPLT
jgi:ABC-type branched-subunit amino acid transport system ATPase component